MATLGLPSGLLSAVLRFVLTIVVGPALGVLVFLVVFSAIDLVQSPGRMPSTLNDPFQVMSVGYVLGLIPAGLGACFMACFAWFNSNLRSQLKWALPLGGLAGFLGIRTILYGVGAFSAFDLIFDMTAILAGGLALLACTMLYFRFAGLNPAQPA